jgi:hypothetical protein
MFDMPCSVQIVRYIMARQTHWKVDKLTVEVLEQEALALLMLFSLAAGGPCCDQQC